MSTGRSPKTLTIGSREMTMLAVALAILALGIFVFVLGVMRFSRQNGEAIPLPTPTPMATSRPLPSPSPAPTAQLAPTIAPTLTEVTHTVQSGDTLIGIAAQYGVSLQSILDANGLTLNSTLFAGQTLVISLAPDEFGAWHEVKYGETLISIAAQYGITPEAIQQQNGLADVDSIFIGQRLYISLPQTAGGEAGSGEGDALPTAQGDPFVEEGPPMSSWVRSRYEGAPEDLAANYPLTLAQDRFTLHYQPETYPAAHLEETLILVSEALTHVEAKLETRLTGSFDVYVAGTLFEYPNAALRGFSNSQKRRVFFLYDGSGYPAERAYLIAHELTHLVAWNMWGTPSSMILSEGLAVTVAEDRLVAGDFLSSDQLCLSIAAAGKMPAMIDIEKDFAAFQGHGTHRFNYFGSGCFIESLIAAKGLETFSALYHDSAYETHYGQSLSELDAVWRENLKNRQNELATDAGELVAHNQEWVQAAAFVYKNYNGTLLMHRAYAALTRAQTALWRGDYAEVRRWLDEVYTLTGYRP